jgi:hypothetical protein
MEPHDDPNQKINDNKQLQAQGASALIPSLPGHASYTLNNSLNGDGLGAGFAQHVPSTATVYFIFEDDKFDKMETPNKIVLAKGIPTVQDFCATIKSLFFPIQDVTLTCSWIQNNARHQYPEENQNPIPTNDRNVVLLLKTRHNEGTLPHRMNPHNIQMLQFLQHLGTNYGWDMSELISIFQQHKINIDNIRNLKEQHLEEFGIKEVGLRMTLLDAIQKYFSSIITMPTVNMSMGSTMHSDSTIGVKRKLENASSPMGTKKSKIMNASGQLKKKNIKFKDLDELINEPTIPVGVGTQVHCSGSDIRGIVILNKQRKAMIDYTIDNKKKLATIPQFYKSVTGMPLHAKGSSWANIFFTDPTTGQSRSLEDLKYLFKGPKKAISAFLFFSKEVRDTIGKDLNNEEFAKRSGEEWKILGEDQKKKYRLKEDADRERYTKEKNDWMALTGQLEAAARHMGIGTSPEDVNGSPEMDINPIDASMTSL